MWRIWKWKEKRAKNRNIQSRDLNLRFSVIFPPMIWIFMQGEGDEIKSKHASKRDRTLTKKAKTYWAGVLRKLVLIQAFPECLELRTKFWLLFGDLWQFWLAPSTSSYSGISLQTRQDKNINTKTIYIKTAKNEFSNSRI